MVIYTVSSKNTGIKVTMRALIFIALITLTATSLGAPVTLCPERCSCTASGNHLKARCNSLDFLKKTLTTEQIESIVALDVSGASIVKINPNLKKLRALKRINFSSNKIQHIVGANLPNSLEYLNLSKNYIKHVPQDLHLLPALKEVDFYGNPIVCNCDSVTVRDKLSRKGVVFNKSLKCVFPENIKGQPWKSVNCNEHGLFGSIQGDAPYEGSGFGEDVSLPTESYVNEDKSENWDISEEEEFIPVQSTTLKPTTIEPEELEGSGESTEISAFNDTSHDTFNFESEEDDDEDESLEFLGVDNLTTVEPPVEAINNSFLNSGPVLACNFNCSTPPPLDNTNETDVSPPLGLLEIIQIIEKDLGIFGEQQTTTVTTQISTTEDDVLLPETKITEETEVIKKSLNLTEEAGQINENTKSSNITYIFLGVLLLGIVAFVVFVVIKRRRSPRTNNSATQSSPEELELVKKPISSSNDKPNGTHETVSLLNDHNKLKSSEEVNGDESTAIPEKYIDDEDNQMHQLSVEDNELFPETKRVTIKATEIPNLAPKTPILITRHLNSDGNMVATISNGQPV